MSGYRAAVLAHGLDGSSDLPIPSTYALIGAAWALTFTFAVVAFAWRQPRFDTAKSGRALPVWVTKTVDAPITRWLTATVALLFTAWVVIAGWFGPQTDDNPLLGSFYVLLWVGLVAVALAVGPIWRVISPVRTLYRLVPQWLRRRPRRYPPCLGYYPAAAGLFAFVWLELASPNPGSLTAVKTWLISYFVVMLVGGAIFGTRWFGRADPFEVYSMVVSRLSIVRRNRDTGLVAVGNPFDHLLSLPIRPGVVVLLSVVLGSTAFDSFAARPGWRGFVEGLAGDSVVSATVLRTATLLMFVAVVVVTFSAAARSTGGVDGAQRQALPGQLAHCMIPIVVGYIFAHYLSYLVERGPQTLLALTDPLGRGWNVLGLGNREVAYLLSAHPGVLATMKVACVVAGHIAAVIAAHDRALRLLPRGHQLTGQLAMMLVMVGYTFTGLYLLFGG